VALILGEEIRRVARLLDEADELGHAEGFGEGVRQAVFAALELPLVTLAPRSFHFLQDYRV